MATNVAIFFVMIQPMELFQEKSKSEKVGSGSMNGTSWC